MPTSSAAIGGAATPKTSKRQKNPEPEPVSETEDANDAEENGAEENGEEDVPRQTDEVVEEEEVEPEDVPPKKKSKVAHAPNGDKWGLSDDDGISKERAIPVDVKSGSGSGAASSGAAAAAAAAA